MQSEKSTTSQYAQALLQRSYNENSSSDIESDGSFSDPDYDIYGDDDELEGDQDDFENYDSRYNSFSSSSEEDVFSDSEQEDRKQQANKLKDKYYSLKEEIRRQRNEDTVVDQSPNQDFRSKRTELDKRVKNLWRGIIDKYSRYDEENQGDIVNLDTMTIEHDTGHLLSMGGEIEQDIWNTEFSSGEEDDYVDYGELINDSDSESPPPKTKKVAKKKKVTIKEPVPTQPQHLPQMFGNQPFFMPYFPYQQFPFPGMHMGNPMMPPQLPYPPTQREISTPPIGETSDVDLSQSKSDTEQVTQKAKHRIKHKDKHKPIEIDNDKDKSTEVNAHKKMPKLRRIIRAEKKPRKKKWLRMVIARRKQVAAEDAAYVAGLLLKKRREDNGEVEEESSEEESAGTYKYAYIQERTGIPSNPFNALRKDEPPKPTMTSKRSVLPDNTRLVLKMIDYRPPKLHTHLQHLEKNNKDSNSIEPRVENGPFDYSDPLMLLTPVSKEKQRKLSSQKIQVSPNADLIPFNSNTSEQHSVSPDVTMSFSRQASPRKVFLQHQEDDLPEVKESTRSVTPVLNNTSTATSNSVLGEEEDDSSWGLQIISKKGKSTFFNSDSESEPEFESKSTKSTGSKKITFSPEHASFSDDENKDYQSAVEFQSGLGAKLPIASALDISVTSKMDQDVKQTDHFVVSDVIPPLQNIPPTLEEYNLESSGLPDKEVIRLPSAEQIESSSSSDRNDTVPKLSPILPMDDIELAKPEAETYKEDGSESVDTPIIQLEEKLDSEVTHQSKNSPIVEDFSLTDQFENKSHLAKSVETISILSDSDTEESQLKPGIEKEIYIKDEFHKRTETLQTSTSVTSPNLLGISSNLKLSPVILKKFTNGPSSQFRFDENKLTPPFSRPTSTMSLPPPPAPNFLKFPSNVTLNKAGIKSAEPLSRVSPPTKELLSRPNTHFVSPASTSQTLPPPLHTKTASTSPIRKTSDAFHNFLKPRRSQTPSRSRSSSVSRASGKVKLEMSNNSFSVNSRFSLTSGDPTRFLTPKKSKRTRIR